MTRISGGSSRPSAPKSEPKSESKSESKSSESKSSESKSSESKDEAPKSSEAKGSAKEAPPKSSEARGAAKGDAPKSSEARGAEKEEVSEASEAERSEEAQRTQKEEQAREAQERERDTSRFEQQKPSNGPVELNPASKAGEAEAASTDAQREKEIRAQLERTNTGREAQRILNESQAQLAFEDGDRAYYEPSSNRVMVGRNLSPEDASSAVVNEATHAEARANGTSPDPTQVSREEYVNGMLREEAESSAREIEHRRELTEQGLPAGTTTSLDNTYSDAMVNSMVNGASEADARQAARQAVTEGLQRGDTVASVTGQNYANYYSQQYDRVQSGEVAAADVVRSDDKQPRLQHPEKIGVVLNAPAGQLDPKTGKPALPSAAELTQQGVGRVRITVSAQYLQDNPDAQPEQEGGTLSESKLKDWKSQLKEYKDAGIEVTLNLPPELVNGKPDFPRMQKQEDGTWKPGSYKIEDDAIKQQGEVQDTVSNDDWNPYQKNWVDRAGELAKQLGPSVDNWEVGNEPDALEKVFMRGDVDKSKNEKQPTLSPGDGNDYNVNASFDPGMPPRRYGQLLNAAYKAIKDNDNSERDTNNPNPSNQARVITAGLIAGDAGDGLDGRDGKSYLEKVNEEMAKTGEELHFDAVAVHPYTKNKPEQFRETVDFYQRMVDEKLHKPGVPIYVTEASPGPGDPKKDEDQATHKKYIEDIARETDTNNQVAGTYFFWGGSFDSHQGLTNMPKSKESLRQLLGK